MPNVNEFKNQCAALGLQHVEVKDGYVDNVHSLDDILNPDGSPKLDTISVTTYETYEDDLKTTDIVFFCQDDQIHGVSFLANAVFFTESGGNGDESWTYKTHKLTVPINGGTRTFSEAMKDELIASGIIGIVADSLDDRIDPEDDTSDYKANSLFGKIENKLAELKGNKATLAGVKIPWLYNMVIFNDRGAEGLHPDFSSNTYRGCDSQSRTAIYEPFGNSAPIPFYTATYSIASGDYIYGFQTISGSSSFGRTSEAHAEKALYESWMTRNPKCYQSQVRDCTLEWCLTNCYNSSHNSNAQINGRRSLSTVDHGLSYNETPYKIDGGSFQKKGATLYQKSNAPGYATISFSEQPFLYGMVFFITEIHASSEIPFIGGYFTIVGINKQGKIITPKVPWYASDEWYYLTNGSYVSKSAGLYYDLDPSRIHVNSLQTITIVSDNSKYSPLKGKILFECSLCLTPTEANYAENLNYIISPDAFIPNNYFDDEEE